MKKKIVSFLIAVTALVVCLCGFSACASEKTFEKAGMKITLTSDFYEKELASQTAYYESSSAIVTALKEEFTLMSGLSGYSLSKYTDMVLTNNRISAEKHEREGKEYIYFTYEKTVSGKDFYYLATTHKADDAFWLIQFACVTSDKDEFSAQFLEWADTITFDSVSATV